MKDFNENDKSLINSIKLSKQNLPQFLSEFDKTEKDNENYFAKLKLSENRKTEHIWIEILSLNNENSIGLIGNEPKNLKKLQYLDTVKFDIQKAEDIMIIKNDSIIFGGFLKSELDKK